MIPDAIANHLWQSTVFAALCAVAALGLRKNRAAVRHGIWLAASVKFLIPFSLLITTGSHLGWRAAPKAIPARSPAAVVVQISQPFLEMPLVTHSTLPKPPAIQTAMKFGAGVWLGGGLALLSFWFVRWRRIRAMVYAGRLLPLEAPIPVRSSSSVMEPGVFGIFRPRLLLPAGIAERLTPAQLQAILTHELCHVRRRDNLSAAMHMTIEAIFWFHPLVWWIGTRLVDERERACDEEVLRSGSEPEVYAEGILNVCKFYLRSPLVCASGVTGSDLKKRIEAIMTDRTSHNMSCTRKVLLIAAAVIAVSVPVAIGVVHAQEPKLVFEVASIKPSQPDEQGGFFRALPGGGLSIHNGSVRQFITFAYDLQEFQLAGGPGWIESARFDILAKPERSEASGDLSKMTDSQVRLMMDRQRLRMRSLLAERFELAIHRESKEFPVYLLVIGRNGPRLQDAKPGPMHMRNTRGQIEGTSAPMELLTRSLSMMLRRTVLDRTGLTAKYDFKLQWTSESAPGPSPAPDDPIPNDPDGPTLFTAIQEQLGLKLEAGRGPVDVYVIERVEKPTEN